MDQEHQQDPAPPVPAPERGAPDAVSTPPMIKGNAAFTRTVAAHASRTEGSGVSVPAAAHLARVMGNTAFSRTIGRHAAPNASGIGADGSVTSDVQAAIDRSRGAGQSLEETTRRRMAPALGDDLGDVRVHTGSAADGLARSVSAEAFATGSDIYFSEGSYRPSADDGQRLIAHELAHVVQQRGAPAGGRMRVSEPGETLEQEADRAADAVLQRSAAEPAPLEVKQRAPPPSASRDCGG